MLSAIASDGRFSIPGCARFAIAILLLSPPIVLADLTGTSAGKLEVKLDEDDSLDIAPRPPPPPPYVQRATNHGYFAIDPHHANTLFSASYGSGIWKTTDGGTSWASVNRGLVNLMVNDVVVDPYQPNYVYALQSVRHGSASGQVYRSTDNGDAWFPLGECESPFSLEQGFPGNGDETSPMSVSVSSDSGKSIWLAQSGSSARCGGPFRSLEDLAGGAPAGEKWCSFMELDKCDTTLRDADCLTGNTITSEDFAGAVGIDGTSEAYSFGLKQQYDNPFFTCKTVYRTRTTDPSTLAWQPIDRWLGPFTPSAPFCPVGSILFQQHRTRHVIFDPDEPGLRFSSYKLFKNVPLALHQLHIAYHAGSESGGFRDWNSAVDLVSCFDLTDNDCDVPLNFPPTNCDGPAQKRCCNASPDFGPYQFWRSPSGDSKSILGMGPGFQSILRCDTRDPHSGLLDTTRCQVGTNWECIWNGTSASQGGNGGCAIACAPGQVAPTLQQTSWTRMVAKRDPGPDGVEEVLLKSRRLYARDEFLRIHHNASGWHDELLSDPRTCKSGYGLFTPVQLIQYDAMYPNRLYLISPRHWFCSNDGGGTWSVCDPVEPAAPAQNWQAAPTLAQGSLNPSVLFASGGRGLYRSTDSGTSFHRVDKRDSHPGDPPFPPNPKHCEDEDWDSATPGDQGAGCRSHPFPTRCGRANVMCGGVNQLAVDPTRDDTVFAATEQGIWRFRYPFDGSDPTGCRPLILPQDLTDGGLAYSAELGWTAAGLGDRGFLSIAIEPGNALHMLAGGKTQPTAANLGGLYESTDGGGSWAQLGDVDTNAGVFKIAFAPGGDIFVASEAGLYKRTSPTMSFVRTLPGPSPTLPPIIVRDVSVLGTNVYVAAGDDDAGSNREGLYSSTDGGQNFVRILAANRNQNLRSVLAYTDATSTDHVLAGTLGEGLLEYAPILDASCNGRLARLSKDGSLGSTGMGSALAGIGDTGLGSGKFDCRPEWASVQFTPGPLRARVRVLNLLGDDLVVPPIDPAEDLSVARATLQGVGDLNGDGCSEVAIGLPSTVVGTGVVKILSACPGIVGGPVLATLVQPTAMDFGMALASDGKLLAVGAPGGPFLSQRVFVYDLATILSSALPIQTLIAPVAANSFGWSLAFGDMDGDGNEDLAIGAPDVGFGGTVVGAGHVYIYRRIDWSLIRTITGASQQGLGFSLSSGYDRLGPTGVPDGKDDLVIGAPGTALSTGAAYWLAGFDAPLPPALPGAISGDLFGYSVLLTRDVDDDGSSDVLVGAPGHDGTLGSNQGKVYVYNGAGVLFCDEMQGSAAGGSFGGVLAEAGDVDASRTTDILIGEPAHPVSGRAWLRPVLW